MAFPAQNYARYAWRKSDADPAIVVREAAGGERYEDFLNRYVHGAQNLFLGVQLALATPVEHDAFLRAARSAWIALRHAVPSIALTTKQDADDNTLMTYHVANTLAEATAWAEHTVQSVSDHANLDALRVELGKRTIPDAHGHQTFLYIIPQSSTEFGVLLHTHHTPMDGAGTKIVLTRFLAILAKYIGDQELATKDISSLSWGQEADNLLPAYSEVVNADQPLTGPLYEQTLGSIMQGFVQNIPRTYGYKKRGEGLGAPRRLEHKFSADETSKIISVGRELGLTVNSLVHAAVFLSALYDNPASEQTAPDAAFFSFGLVDSRARLRAPFNEPHGYPGYCLAISGITVPLTDVQGDDKRSKLLSVANAVKKEYADQKALPALLTVIAQEIDFVIAAAKSGPPPPPWLGPWYAGDGIGERYLDPVYKSSAGEEVIRVSDFFTSLNQVEPGPYFRSYSWAGRLTVSADYNDIAMPSEACDAFLRNVVESLSTLL